MNCDSCEKTIKDGEVCYAVYRGRLKPVKLSYACFDPEECEAVYCEKCKHAKAFFDKKERREVT